MKKTSVAVLKAPAANNGRLASRNHLDKNNNPNTDGRLPPIDKRRANTQSATDHNHKKDHTPPSPTRAQSTVQEAINNLVHEYLIKYNYPQTLEAFQNEFYAVQPARQETHLKDQLLDVTKLTPFQFVFGFCFQAFDKGNRQAFFAKFAKYTPVNIRLKDQRTNKLEFYLNIYFLVFTVHPFAGNPPEKKAKTIETKARQAFRNYLQTRGATLAKTSEFLDYYALAYIQPHQNQNYKAIFTKQWVDELRERLIEFIEFLYPHEKQPFLVTIYEKYIESRLAEQSQISNQSSNANPETTKSNENNNFNNNGNANIMGSSIRSEKQQEAIAQQSARFNEPAGENTSRLQQQNQKLYNQISYITNRYRDLQNYFKEFQVASKNTFTESLMKWFHITQKFFNISTDLISIAEKLQQGIPLASDDLIEKHKKKVLSYEKFFNTNVQDLMAQNVDYSFFEKRSVSAENDPDQPSVFQGGYDRTPPMQLDFDKIKDTLNSGDARRICLLLEALRLRITRIRGAYSKRELTLLCTKNDILGLVGQTGLLQKLMNRQPRLALETAHFVVALTSDYYGRVYLCTEGFVSNFIRATYSQQGDTTLRRFLVKVLQEMSLKRSAKLWMIGQGMVSWINGVLKTEKQTISTSGLQYLMALLINLILSKQGLAKSEEVRDEFLKNMIDLLESSNHVRMYANAVLFAVLALKSFREKAQEFGLYHIIQSLKQDCSQMILNQLDYLQKVLAKGDEQQEPDDDDDDAAGEVDDINDDPIGDEPYDQKQAELSDLGGPVYGQALLIKEYVLTGPAIIHQINTVAEEVQRSLRNRQLNDNILREDRPVSQSRSITRQIMKNKSNLNNNNSQTLSGSNRALVSGHLQRAPTSMRGDGGDLGQSSLGVTPNNNPNSNQPISPISPTGEARRPLRAYQLNPQYKQVFQTRSQLVRTPPNRT